MPRRKILLLEPFMAGSHAAWARGYQQHSRHQIEIMSLPGRHWKWRMHGGAVSLAEEFLQSKGQPDLILASAMLDLTSFLALTRSRTASLPIALYFHENQLSYPWSEADADPSRQRDAHYIFMNYSSALAADRVLFNSDYQRCDFLTQLPAFLSQFPDCSLVDTLATIANKSQTLPLGLDLCRFDRQRRDCLAEGKGQPPLILWNHRWEYDKNPQAFFAALLALQQRGVDFRLAVLGEAYRRQPQIFAEARQQLAGKIVHWGYVESFADYASWLWRADLLPVTSIHDFFGISVVEAAYCGCQPLLPKRLAYPEHFDPAGFSDCYYEDENDLLDKLAARCQNPGRTDSERLREAVAGYDWRTMAGKYDKLLSELINDNRKSAND